MGVRDMRRLVNRVRGQRDEKYISTPKTISIIPGGIIMAPIDRRYIRSPVVGYFRLLAKHEETFHASLRLPLAHHFFTFLIQPIIRSE